MQIRSRKVPGGCQQDGVPPLSTELHPDPTPAFRHRGSKFPATANRAHHALPLGRNALKPPANPNQLVKLKFTSPDKFLNALRSRVDEYFFSTGLPRRDCPAMYRKTAVVMAWYVVTYVLLVFFATTLWQAIPLAILVGMAMAAIGFNIQHDGGHNGYSDRPWVNRLAAMTMDMLGASSYIWRQQHNVVHHSYANIHEHDADIDLSVFGRLCPSQKRYWFHRWQHIYLWPLYGLVAIKWQFVDDFRDCIKGRICGHRFPRPRGKELAILVGGKLFYATTALVIPIMLHGWLIGISFYLLASFVQGVIMSTVIQLAHAVGEAEFPLPAENGRMETSWAVHQVLTTVDFARDSRIVSWYTGGLNFQTEHHLFPRICHVNYPAISKIVQQTCHEFGLPYREFPTFWAGVVAHYRWLRQMGQPETAMESQGDSSLAEIAQPSEPQKETATCATGSGAPAAADPAAIAMRY